jgi:hypothetical protein
MLLFTSNFLLAEDYFYLRNVQNCFIKTYSKGKFTAVNKNEVVNIPLELKQLKRTPQYISFQQKGRTYIASTNCLYLANQDHPEIIDTSTDNAVIAKEVEADHGEIRENNFQKYFIEMGGGIANIADQGQVPLDYNIFVKPDPANPLIWSDAAKSAYKTKMLFNIGFGIKKFKAGFLAFKVRVFKGTKTDTLSVSSLNNNTTVAGDWVYSDAITNFYVGHKHLFLNDSAFIPTLAGYVGLSSGSTILSDGVNLYTFSSLGMALYLEAGLEYLVNSSFGIGVNLGYENIGTRNLKPTDNSGTLSSTQTKLNYSNFSGTIGIKSYF